MSQNKYQNQYKNGSLSTKLRFCHGHSSPLTTILTEEESVSAWIWESEGSGEVLHG